MKASTAAHGHVDGAWRPRSTDPAAEFPELVLAMSSWVGPVIRVTYNLARVGDILESNGTVLGEQAHA